MTDYKEHVRIFADHPEPGFTFYDIGPLFKDPEAFDSALSEMEAALAGSDVNLLASLESRGHAFAPAMARSMGIGWQWIRKEGKLPGKLIREDYSVEYRPNSVIELQVDAFGPGDEVEIVDDVLATGGSAAAAARAIQRTGATVIGISVFAELEYLEGRAAIAREFPGLAVSSLISYEVDPLAEQRAT